MVLCTIYDSLGQYLLCTKRWPDELDVQIDLFGFLIGRKIRVDRARESVRLGRVG